MEIASNILTGLASKGTINPNDAILRISNQISLVAEIPEPISFLSSPATLSWTGAFTTRDFNSSSMMSLFGMANNSAGVAWVVANLHPGVWRLRFDISAFNDTNPAGVATPYFQVFINDHATVGQNFWIFNVYRTGFLTVDSWDSIISVPASTQYQINVTVDVTGVSEHSQISLSMYAQKLG